MSGGDDGYLKTWARPRERGRQLDFPRGGHANLMR